MIPTCLTTVSSSATGEQLHSLSAAADKICSAMTGDLASSASEPALLSSPIMPISLLCAVLCCICGYVAFRVLQAHEQVYVKPAEELKARRYAIEGDAEISAGTQPPRNEVKSALHGPATPNATPQALGKPRLDSEDGNSSVMMERAPSTQAPDGASTDPRRALAASSFRAPGAAAERGPVAADVPDGERSYVWDDGSEYFGEWRAGRAQGRGVFSWPSGDRYEGEWLGGREDGVGTFISVDGSTFYGFWSEGKMQGEGVYKPATVDNQVIFMREYDDGRLIKETVLRVKDYDLHRKELKRDQRARRVEKRQAAKDQAVSRPGETIYKGHRSYDLMRNLQLGILFSIAKTNREISERDTDPRASDYKTEVSQQFPRSGQSTSFKWKDYCPHVFHRLREVFGIDNRDYLLSLTGDRALRELPSPGKSGSVFFISDDDRFMIKTVRKEEMRLLLELVPKYYTHCLDNPDTLLTRFYGVHRVKPISGHHVRFLVMGNVFPTETRLHRKYDLKGSTFGRTAGARRHDPGATLKDLDVDFRLQLKDAYCRQLMHQIEADAALLERMHVMDYSLLLGIHYVSNDADFGRPDGRAREPESPTTPPGSVFPPTWSETYAAAVKDAGNFSPERTLFNRYHSQRRVAMDEPNYRGPSSEVLREDDISSRARSQTAASELDPPSPMSSMTSTSMASTAGLASVIRKVNSVEDLRAQIQQYMAISTPSGSWPTSTPPRPTRFALESAHARTSPQPQQEQQRREKQLRRIQRDEEAKAPAPPFAVEPLQCPAAEPSTREDASRAASMLPSDDEEALATGSSRARTHGSPGFLHLLSKVRVRQQQQDTPPRPCLDRTRSGWLRGGPEATSLRSLHSEARRHMGVSIPALVHPLRPDGTADLDAKPLPVTLFFGIIDFLQDYNVRKRTEHVLKSMVRDGRAISVTNPHTYAQRFTSFMQNLFITIPPDSGNGEGR